MARGEQGQKHSPIIPYSIIIHNWLTVLSPFGLLLLSYRRFGRGYHATAWGKWENQGKWEIYAPLFLRGRKKYQHSLDTGTQKTESASAKFRVWSVVAPKHTLGFISLQSATTLGVIFLHSRRQRIRSHEVWGHRQMVWTSASKYHRRCVPRNHTSSCITVIDREYDIASLYMNVPQTIILMQFTLSP